ncbi:MAG: Methylase involved in ubiquinone/menaquinone biosynthesis [Candidatus Woesebacteria bacterium GW2011_GWA1_33_30]|uniref:Methylase involved in ubiquinone/menaquinone biosynthesis n=1 Tax=Candidatus Woesebacteria bacterium GW2011_GWA2_33_28 TaxID=1618561 RepID=A0A0F9ZVS2_9BACT|nr:MAG: Methylase involved in ubiquinone/menaquinone biosynthesis [Candidatus Woesebacteria bacterium GW2011_GWA2_33_28]KKP49091.1 MAG: Methylase involved in ubiquinone/menaquinone biosynthesis [Candidatus Woesebacteria bacterium GW2011_GWA1_33_30]KKP50309.1 MAG: Methylase involved in ubiquinone/menaquinone biosynthesis [Microgenomates group bacterium GW2011_GWC1_33_32]KKP52682.1 MAG: Methylase involved in ubiquinone/menaquinone biosynthesis [Candidatus Woesebacteria bacterium GW2011_GWB1_33_38]
MNTFSEKQRQFYNSSAKKYDNRSFGVYQRANRNHYKKIEKILSIVKKYIPKKILEVGTGTGIHAQWLLKKTKGKISYWGIDISEEMLKASKERIKNIPILTKPVFKCVDANKLPFKNNFFDMVFCSGTLHHMDQPRQVVKEMARVLKTGGKMVIIEPNRNFPLNFIAGIIDPIERNILKFSRNNFKIWADGLIKINKLENFNYTPPAPKLFFRFYDFIDNLFKTIPLIKDFSIMIYMEGTK